MLGEPFHRHMGQGDGRNHPTHDTSDEQLKTKYDPSQGPFSFRRDRRNEISSQAGSSSREESPLAGEWHSKFDKEW